MTRLWKYSLLSLILVAVAVWLSYFQTPSTPKIVGCDVGQGDAFLIISGTDQVLIDGGLPNGKVVDCLSRHLSPFDRDIEVVINTHPQLDHYGGLIEVMERYNVSLFVATPLDSGSTEYQVLKERVGSRGVRMLKPDESTDIRVGLIYLDILWPTHEFQNANLDFSDGSKSNILGSATTSLDPNELSVVVLLRLNNYKALFTGDIGPKVSDSIAAILQEKQMERVDYIKVPHHGSRNGMTEKLLQALMPKVAVISTGRNNRYGHPHKEILDMLSKYGVEVFGTYDEGDVVMTVD